MKVAHSLGLVAIFMGSTASASKCRPRKTSSSVSSIIPSSSISSSTPSSASVSSISSVSSASSSAPSSSVSSASSASSASSVSPDSSISSASSPSSSITAATPLPNFCDSTAQLLVNSGFEDGLTGWSSTQNGVAARSGCHGSNSEVNIRCAEFTFSSNTARLSQTLATKPGATYALIFDYVSEATFSAPTAMNVIIQDAANSNSIEKVIPIPTYNGGPSSGWATFVDSFEAASASTVILIQVSAANTIKFQLTAFTLNEICLSP